MFSHPLLEVEIKHSAAVLVQLVVLKLDKVVKEARPCLGVVIVAEIPTQIIKLKRRFKDCSFYLLLSPGQYY